MLFVYNNKIATHFLKTVWKRIVQFANQNLQVKKQSIAQLNVS